MLNRGMPPTTILDTDPMLKALRDLAGEAGYRVEFGLSELGESGMMGVCVYAKRLIQLDVSLRREPRLALWNLIHEVAHALLHDAYEDDADGGIGAAHEKEANSIRKMIWPQVDGYPFSYGDTLSETTPVVLAAANRELAALGLSPAS